MKKTALFNIIFTCLIIISSYLQAKGNDVKTIQSISQINFILKLQFPNNTYVLNSADKNLNDKIERLGNEDFSTLQTRILSVETPIKESIVSIIPETRIKNIRGAFDALLSAATVYYQGHRDLELDKNNKLGITHQAKSTILLSPSTFSKTTIHYQIRSNIFLENLVVLMEKLNKALLHEPINYSVFTDTSTDELQIVTQFLNAQSCLILRECVEANIKNSMRLQFNFTNLKEENLAKLFLGLNFEAYTYMYPANDLSALYFLYFLKATNKESIDKIILRLESYINYSSEDPYKSLKQLKYLLSNYKHKPYIYNKLLKIDKEFRLKPVFTSDISDMKEKVERTTKLLEKLIATNDAYLPYSTRFEVDILRTEDNFPIDHTLVDYQLFYQLFKRAMLEQNIRNAAYYTSVYSGRILEFLSKNYQDKFIESLILDMKLSPEFISALKHQFSFYWGVQEQYQDFYWTFMLKVEEGYNNTSKERIEAVINERKMILRQAIKNKIIKKEQSSLRWWQRKYKNKERSPKDFYKAMHIYLKESSYPKEHAFTVADIFTKLIIVEMKNKDFTAGKQLIIYYIDKLLPLVGAHEKTTDISSNGLVLSIYSKDEELSKIIFSKLLGEEFKIEEAKNEILVYNLACYHAIYKEKELMLLAIRQALNLGKKAQQFLNDSDFKPYLQDVDFMSILQENKLLGIL